MSRQFESGEQGVSAIGYDIVGGTSYGMYQFSSKQGTLDAFIQYLYNKAPDLAYLLQNAGNANTGSTKGKMPFVWKQIAKEYPERFADLQHTFAIEYYYRPVAEDWKNNVPQHKAIRELLFSTAIQHGVQGANAIIQQALKTQSSSPIDFIQAVYTLRKQQFSSSTHITRVAVQKRLNQEMEAILKLYTL